MAQLPALPEGLRRLVRTDSAGASHKFLDHVVGCGWQFSTGFALNPVVKDAIRLVADDDWQPTTRQDGSLREGAGVAEITDLVDLSG